MTVDQPNGYIWEVTEQEQGQQLRTLGSSKDRGGAKALANNHVGAELHWDDYRDSFSQAVILGLKYTYQIHRRTLY